MGLLPIKQFTGVDGGTWATLKPCIDEGEDTCWRPRVYNVPNRTVVDHDFASNKIRRREIFISKPVPIHHKNGIWSSRDLGRSPVARQTLP